MAKGKAMSWENLEKASGGYVNRVYGDDGKVHYAEYYTDEEDEKNRKKVGSIAVEEGLSDAEVDEIAGKLNVSVDGGTVRFGEYNPNANNVQ